MSTTEVLESVKRRGLNVTLKEGRPVLQKPEGSKEVTAALLHVLTIHRERIIEVLSKGN